jgi:ABC-type transporter Mla subunit MlaD
MPVERSHARLGAFLVVVLILAIATGLLFVQQLRSRAVLDLVTYTTENVSGLDVSSPVRLRGVPVGRVTELRVDPLGKTVEIDFEMFLDRLNTLGMDVARIRQTADVTRMFPNLRAQVIGSLVTGEAYLLIDALENPPPAIALGFTPTRAYIPSMPSPRAAVTDRLPDVLERTEATLQVLREIISRIPNTLDRSDRFFTNVERIIRESDLPELSADSRMFFTTTTGQFGQMTSDLQAVIGPEGKLVTFLDDVRAAVEAADLSATNQAARAAADQTVLAADDLRRALPAIRDSLGQLSDLARQLQEQPESMVYGPRPVVKP